MGKAIVWIRKANGKYNGIFCKEYGDPDDIGIDILYRRAEAEASEELYEAEYATCNFDDVAEEDIRTLSKYVDFAYIFKDGEWYMIWRHNGELDRLEDMLALDLSNYEKLFGE